MKLVAAGSPASPTGTCYIKQHGFFGFMQTFRKSAEKNLGQELTLLQQSAEIDSNECGLQSSRAIRFCAVRCGKRFPIKTLKAKLS